MKEEEGREREGGKEEGCWRDDGGSWRRDEGREEWRS